MVIVYCSLSRVKIETLRTGRLKMLRKSANFLFRAGFLARASLFELAAGLMVVYSLQRVFDKLVGDIVLPIMSALFGGFDFSDSFLGLNRTVTATNLIDARKQGAILAYGEFLTTLIGFVIVFFALSLVIRTRDAVSRGSGSGANKLGD